MLLPTRTCGGRTTTVIYATCWICKVKSLGPSLGKYASRSRRLSKLLVPKRIIAREAIDNYLQGRYFLNRRTEQSLRKAIGYFESAINEDHNYAQAYAGLADCYNQLGTAMIGVMPPLEARRTAETAARKALEIDNEVAEARTALGYVN